MPIINPWIFYVISLLDKIGIWTIGMMLILGMVIVVCSVFWGITCDASDCEGINKKLLKYIKMSSIAFIITCLVNVCIPSKETMYTMLVSSQVTYENVETAGNIIQDSVDYIFEKLEGDEE